MSSQLKSWFLMLSSREKTLVSIAAVSVVIMMFWLLIINPILTKNEKLTKLTEAKQTELTLMQRQAVLVKQLQKQVKATGVKKVEGNPQQLIEQALKTWRLKPTLQKMQAQGDKKISLSLKEAEADKVMRFIAELETKYGLASSNMVISKGKGVGTANVRLSLEKQ